MRTKTYPPDLIRERIVRLKTELRRMRIELRLAEAEERDRERLFPHECQTGAEVEGAERIRKQQRKSPGANLGENETRHNHAEHTTT